MAQAKAFLFHLRVNKSRQQLLLLSVLFGSLLGALCARLHSGALNASFALNIREASFLRALSRACVFPMLTAVALFLQNRVLISSLFFLKGFLTAFLICALGSSGISPLLTALPFFAFEAVLPLPFYILAASACPSRSLDGSASARLLLFMLLPLFFGLLIEKLLF